MRLGLGQSIFSLLALSITLVALVTISQNASEFGNLPLLARAALLDVAVLAFIAAAYPFTPLCSGKPGRYFFIICLPVLLPAFVYYLYLLPDRAGQGLSAEQIQSQLITDRSSNGIIEVGFSYPIYTPTLTISNHELFTRQVNVFLRMQDSSGESSLFRAVRGEIPGSSLSVEATVQGMLSENPEFLFIPLTIPPRHSISGRVVFVISNLEDGSTFTEALGRAYQAQFELRDPETGELLLEFPLTRI